MADLKRIFATGVTTMVLGGTMMAGSVQAKSITPVVLSSGDSSGVDLYTGFHGSAGRASSLTSGDIRSGFGGVTFKEVTQSIVTLTLAGDVSIPAFDLALSLAGGYEGDVIVMSQFTPVFLGSASESGAGSAASTFNFAPVNNDIADFSGAATLISSPTGTPSVYPLATLAPIPAAAVLFGSGLIGMLGVSNFARRTEDDGVTG
ncbi:MAG: hypothetical protein ACFCUG_15110 [Thiotrichales bacterium]